MGIGLSIGGASRADDESHWAFETLVRPELPQVRDTEWLRDDLESGRSCGPCVTYDNAPCLATATEFRLSEVEVWAVEEDPPPPSEEDAAAARGENALTAAGVMSSKHEETRNFLAMAGRTQHAASLAPPPANNSRG